MKTSSKFATVTRVLMGAMLLFSGLNAFFHFAPMPPMPPAAGAFVGALAAAGYFFPLLKITEIVVGALLVSGRFVPLALTVAAPILVNVVAFHAALAPAGLAVPIVLVAAELYLAWTHRDAFAPLLRAKQHGGAQSEPRARAELATAR